MEEIKQILKNGAPEYGVELDTTALERFSVYCSLIIEWNNKMNLTAIKEPTEIAVKHFLDCLSILKYVDIPNGASLIDVGTGAGFPGIPLLIARPDIKLTLLDSLNKRLIFLQEVIDSLQLNATIIHSRAEEGALNPELREKFDFATSRAVAGMNVLAEYCLPYIKVGGCFIAMKGPQAGEELQSAKNAIATLGCSVKNINTFTLQDNSTRCIVNITKNNHTPKQYPRHGSKIAKKPL